MSTHDRYSCQMVRPYIADHHSPLAVAAHGLFHYWTVINTLFYYYKTATVRPGEPPKVPSCSRCSLGGGFGASTGMVPRLQRHPPPLT